jgi:DNA-binding MarR family transcriptional regulator
MLMRDFLFVNSLEWPKHWHHDASGWVLEFWYANQKISYMTNSESNGIAAGGLRLTDYLPYHLTVASNQVSRLIATAYQVRYGITIWQWRVLCTLGTEGAMTAQDVVGVSAMDKVTVSRAIQALRKRGVIQRLRSKQDSRAFDLHLTKHGRAMYDDIIPLALNYQEQLLSNITPEERKMLMDLLPKIRQQAIMLAE